MRQIAILTLKAKLELYEDELRHEFPDTEIVQFGANDSYERLINKAIDLERQGYEAIICRGFSENIINRHVSIPIVLLEPDMSDVLRAVTAGEIKPGTEIAIVLHEKNNLLGYSDVQHYLDRVFGLKAEIYTYSGAHDFESVVMQALKTGRHILSSNLAIKAAEKAGVPHSLFCVGMNAIRDAAMEAIKIVDVRRRDASQNEKVRMLLNHSEEGVVCIDEAFSVEWINDYAKEVLNIGPDESQDTMRIHDCMPTLDWDRVFDEEFDSEVISSSQGKTLIANTKPFRDRNRKEAFIFFRDVTDVVADEKRVREELHRKGTFAKFNLDDIKGISKSIEDCKEETRRCAKFDANVLIYGESGVGKELFAQCIHNESRRAKEAFYAINCAALPSNLLESELFGYSDGAFTGARKGGKAGIFEMAHNGTVFLDEIGELPIASQSALLRVIQSREIRRIGDDSVIPVDVRIIAASNKDIYKEVQEKRFREDLFYRLSTVFLNIPPLRERGEDIIYLFNIFAENESKKNGTPYTGSLSEEARKYLLEYRWQGNIRELENFVQRLFVFGYNDKVLTKEGAIELLSNTPRTEKEEGELPKELFAKQRKVVREDIIEALSETKGNRSEAARRLGISRTHLWRLIKESQEKNGKIS